MDTKWTPKNNHIPLYNNNNNNNLQLSIYLSIYLVSTVSSVSNRKESFFLSWVGVGWLLLVGCISIPGGGYKKIKNPRAGNIFWGGRSVGRIGVSLFYVLSAPGTGGQRPFFCRNLLLSNKLRVSSSCPVLSHFVPFRAIAVPFEPSSRPANPSARLHGRHADGKNRV